MTEKEGIKIICDNRKAFHHYFFEDKYEAGIVLTGTEVKALRTGKGSLQDSYADFFRGELFLLNAHIGPYAMGNRQNHEPRRRRKLLMHRKQLEKLRGKSDIRGYSIIPLKFYFSHGIIKVELGLGRGKKSFDKRQTTKDREEKRKLDRIMRRH